MEKTIHEIRFEDNSLILPVLFKAITGMWKFKRIYIVNRIIISDREIGLYGSSLIHIL